jgi:hypothetical protein
MIREPTPDLADDLLQEAHEIAEFIFGDPSRFRSVYHLKRKGLPTFKLGSTICARKSTILEWIAAQERRSKSKTTA